jgi:hypothetical protein
MCGELYLATEGLISNMNMLYTMLEGNKYKKLVSNTRLQLLHKTIKLLQDANEKLKDEVFINIIEECHHNIDFQHKVSVLNINVSYTNNTTKTLIEYINNNISKLNNNDILQDNINQFINLHILFITRMIKYDYQRFDIYLYETIKIHLINNSFASSGSSTSSKGKGNDDYSKSSMLDKINHMKSIFETNIDNTNQALIELIINKVQLEDDKQINLIANCGDFNKLVNDNKKFMDVMNELIPDITYVNQELLLDNNLSNIKSSFLRKCSSIINYLVSSLSNNSWDNVKNLKDINKFYYEPFIKFQDVQKNFKSYKVFITFINNVISNITLHNNDIYNSKINDIFITEDLRYSYIRLCFLYILSFLLTGHNDKIFNLDNFSNTKINKDKHTSKHIGKHTDKNTESNKESNKSDKVVKSATKVKVTSDNEFSYSSKLDKKQSYVNKGGSFENNNSENMGNYGSLRNNNELSHSNNDDSVHGNNNEINNGSIDEKMDKSLEGIDTELYPEMIVSEHYQNEPGEDVEDDEEEDTILDLIEDSLDNKQNHTHIMKQFVSDIIIYLTDIQHITSSMNNDTVEDEISKGRVTTVKETLRLNRDLSAEGMEDTRAMVNNLRMLGRLDYSNLASNYDNIMYGSGADEESNELEMDNTVPAREMLGDGDRDLFAHNDIHGGDEGYYEEAVYIGVAEDMEGGDFDYGYIGVD